MKLALHLIWSDLRRFRWWVALIAGLVAVMNITGFVVLTHYPIGHNDVEAGIRRLIVWLRTIDVVAAYVFVLILVQADPLVGTNAFWLTRPVSGQRLLVAKFGTIVTALVIIPSVLSLPWWWWCGFGWQETSLAIAEFAILAFVIATPAAFVASLTDSLPRALIWGMLIVPIALTFRILSMDQGWLAAMGTNPLPVSEPFVVPNVALSVLAGFATLFLVTVAQYVWRRLGVSIAVLVAGVGVAYGLSALEVAPLIKLGSQERHPERAAGIHAEFLYGFSSIDEDRGERRGHAGAALHLSGVPFDRVLVGASSKQTWNWAPNPPVERTGISEASALGGNRIDGSAILHALGYQWRPPDAETDAWRRREVEDARARWEAIPGNKEMVERRHRDVEEQRTRLVAQERLHRQKATVATPNVYLQTELPASVVARLWKEPPSYSAQFSLHLVRPVIVASMPFTSAGWKTDYGDGLYAAQEADRPTRLVTIRSEPDGFIRWLCRPVFQGWNSDPVVVLNPAQHEAVTDDIFVYYRPVFTVNSVSIGSVVVRVGEQFVIRNGKKQPPPMDWYQDAIVARIALIEEARFTRTVNVPSEDWQTHEKAP